MKNPALITPSVMKWARETAGMSVEDAVARFAKSVAKSITAQTVKNWESGKGAPTYRQLEKVAQLRKNRTKSSKSESSGFGTYADKLCSYRSKSYTQAVCLQYRRHLIDRHELADYLHITMKHVDDIVDFALY